MEEILSSIRKMISDDRPGPSPMPDQLSRMHFGEQNRASHAPASASQPGGQSSNFNSLADALKVATALSDQRRSLQHEIASVLDKGPRRTDPLSEGPAPVAKRHPSPDTAPAADGKRELLSFDFGTVVPQREDQSAKAGADAKPAVVDETPRAEAEKAENKVEQPAEEPRVLPLRPATGLSGSAAPNVAPFPRPARETAKPVAEAAPAPTAEKAPEKTVNIETPVAAAEQAAQHVAEVAAAKTEAASAQTEALLDAVVDMVQQDPSKLSVFTSGASFISGVVDKTKVSNKPVVADKLADNPDASSVGGAPPKMDRAAAELLRPMLRQWLAENMPRIVEDALRSELTEQTQGDGKGPGKA
jgi:cell pole-organizing protein PopZ